MNGPGVRGLAHLGVAVVDVDTVAATLCAVLGAERLASEVLERDGLRVVSIRAGDAQIELFEPTRADGTVQRFLERRGNAIHHLCLAVDDLDAELARLRSAGVRLIDETPRPGAGGKRVAFVHPQATGGILIELAEPPGRQPRSTQAT